MKSDRFVREMMDGDMFGILFIVFTTLANSETGVKPLRGYIN